MKDGSLLTRVAIDRVTNSLRRLGRPDLLAARVLLAQATRKSHWCSLDFEDAPLDPSRRDRKYRLANQA